MLQRYRIVKQKGPIPSRWFQHKGFSLAGYVGLLSLCNVLQRWGKGRTFLSLSSLTILCVSLWWGGPSLSVSEVAAVNNRLPRELKGVGVRKSLGQTIDLNLTFRDSAGKTRRLKHYFDGKKPVILTLNYFRCPQLCTLQLNGFIKAVNKLKQSMNSKYRVLTVSFNHRETPDLAHAKRKNYLAQLGKRKLDWEFLVGSQASIQKLTQALGFKFKYIEREKQYAHPAVIYILTPQGKVSQFLSGIEFKKRDLRFALIDASQGKLGSLLDAFVMSCFVYSSSEGKYTTFAFGFVRLGGGLTLLILGLFLGFLWFREHQKGPKQVESPK
ncbi:MAG: SCO family protein [Deltaproteobacteria bacterium]|nr:MAG: SCO family protein [Deltaproteobacteria bacterium]